MQELSITFTKRSDLDRVLDMSYHKFIMSIYDIDHSYNLFSVNGSQIANDMNAFIRSEVIEWVEKSGLTWLDDVIPSAKIKVVKQVSFTSGHLDFTLDPKVTFLFKSEKAMLLFKLRWS